MSRSVRVNVGHPLLFNFMQVVQKKIMQEKKTLRRQYIWYQTFFLSQVSKEEGRVHAEKFNA